MIPVQYIISGMGSTSNKNRNQFKAFYETLRKISETNFLYKRDMHCISIVSTYQYVSQRKKKKHKDILHYNQIQKQRNLLEKQNSNKTVFMNWHFTICLCVAYLHYKNDT